MRVSELYGKFSGSTWIVGTGPSMQVMPKSYLEGERCILLNDAWMHEVEYGKDSLAFTNNLSFVRDCPLTTIVKARLRFDPEPEKTDNHVPWDHPDYYCFSYRDDKLGDEWTHFDNFALWKEPDFYWNIPGGNVSIFALQFAILAGFTKIHLVGCDCNRIDNRKYMAKNMGHGHKKKFNHNYNAYAGGTMRMIREGRERGVSIVQVNPYAGVGRESKQFREMLTW